MALIEPAQVNYFGVLLWDMMGPTNDRGWQAALNVVGGLVANLANLVLGGFEEVSGLDVGMATEDYEEGGNDYSPLHFHKSGEYETVVLKRGATSRTDLWDWHQQVMRGKQAAQRKSGLIILFDRNGVTLPADTDPKIKEGIEGWLKLPIAAWYIHRALPIKVTGPELKAKAAGEEQVAHEEVHLRHEGLTRISLSAIPGGADVATIGGDAAGLLLGGVSGFAGSL